MSDILSLHSPFNSMLNDVAEHFGHHITYVENCTEEWYFDLLGNLNEEGKSEFWHEVNHLMERFDSSKVKLQPRQNYAEQRKYLMKKQNKWLVMCIVRLLRLPWISSYSHSTYYCNDLIIRNQRHFSAFILHHFLPCKSCLHIVRNHKINCSCL